MLLLIKILKLYTYPSIQPIPQGMVTIYDAILEFIIIKKVIKISQTTKKFN